MKTETLLISHMHSQKRGEQSSKRHVRHNHLSFFARDFVLDFYSTHSEVKWKLVALGTNKMQILCESITQWEGKGSTYKPSVCSFAIDFTSSRFFSLTSI